ncbi:MAG: ATP-binding protein [Reyranellaceae bacterium]
MASNATPAGPQGFNLRLWFAIGSFGTIAVICVFAALWVSDFLTHSLLERESEVSQEFLESIVSIDGIDMFREDALETPAAAKLLLDYANHIVSMPGVFRVNVYSPKHRILWSTEKQLIGRQFGSNEDLDVAFAGRRVTEIHSLSDDNKPEYVELGHTGNFIEAYIPIRSNGGRGPVVGVVEFYKYPAALDATIQQGRRIVWIGAAASALVLFLTLYWIVQRGARVIERQQGHMAQLEAFSAIGQMSSAVAHSLRNPMSAIRSSAELWRSLPTEDAKEVTEDVMREVDRMDNYVRELLTFARSEPYHLQPVDTTSVVATVLEKLSRAIARNGIDARSTSTGAVRAMADPMLLEQALTSVLTNAIEAMPSGGRLSVTVGPGRSRTVVRLEIADTGRGIPAEFLQRVLQSPFTTKARGFGLGLVLAKGIITRFGGTLSIDSTAGQGTRIQIDLKAA